MIKTLYNGWVRMKRLREMLVLGMALTGTAVAQARVASATYTYFGTPLKGFRAGEELMVPLDSLAEIGWTATVQNGMAKILAEGNSVSATTRNVQGATCVPFRQIIQTLGGKTRWAPGGYDQLETTGVLHTVNIERGKIKLASSLKFKPTLSFVNNRLMLDLEGIELASDADLQLDANSKVYKFRPNVVRVEMTTRFVPEFPKVPFSETNKLEFDFNPPVAKQDDVPAVKPQREPQVIEKSPVETEIPISVDLDNATQTGISIQFKPGQWTGLVSYRKPNPETLEVILPGFQGTLPEGFKLESGAISNVELGYENESTVLRLNLRRAMGTEVVSDASGIRINLLRPANSGKLAGKIVVIDAGHGGRDKGATYAGVSEKNITLGISKRVKDALLDQGVTVIMTRGDDSFPSLTARPDLANKSVADFFISIHVNHPGSSKRNPSGTMTFYHKNSPMGKFLAECVQAEITKAKLLPSLGVKSDGTIYSSGFAVLRLSKMPSILIETGFITNATDRKVLQTDAFARAMANGIVNGIKMYLGDK
jgi:N-acetylmuramoyl-L-alanine amidase